MKLGNHLLQGTIETWIGGTLDNCQLLSGRLNQSVGSRPHETLNNSSISSFWNQRTYLPFSSKQWVVHFGGSCWMNLSIVSYHSVVEFQSVR